MSEFNHKGIACPTPIIINENDIFNIKEKPCAIYSFVEGSQIQSFNNDSMKSLAKIFPQFIILARSLNYLEKMIC